MNIFIVLEFGVINDEYELVKWYGWKDIIKYGYCFNIYYDMSMKKVFKFFVGWVYVELVKRIGKIMY